MSSGLVHQRYHALGWVVVLPTSLISCVYSPPVGTGILVGYALGRWVDPDLDQVGVSSAEGRIINDFKILGYVIVGYTTIYGAVFRRYHRSFITHFPGVSTAIRLVYLFWWLYFTINILYDYQIMVGIGVWVGLTLSDLVHFIVDNILKD